MAMDQVGARKPHLWRCTSAVYEKMMEAGFFRGQRTELIDGQIMCLAHKSEPHVVAMGKLLRSLHRKLPDSLFVRSQAPLCVDENSRPEPDAAVVDVSSLAQRPTTAHLAVEVLEAPSHFERTIKAAMYASVPVAERWLLDLSTRTLEVQRDPVRDKDSFSGWRYGWTQVLREDASVSPLCAPDVEFTVGEMLP